MCERYVKDSCLLYGDLVVRGNKLVAVGSLSGPVPYWQMQEVYVCVRLDSKSRYVIRIVLPDGSLLLQKRSKVPRLNKFKLPPEQVVGTSLLDIVVCSLVRTL
ncbi:hypothetical protein Fcan01_03662 [Folsomia candida]|uniref:C-Maf-inducing protein PH domain-containing protein n=1 Tax=Folsomia candida TaxID=158441 RepID=A0A226EYM4_FOLCA|nr:hypothetical protein Fcan01_03662 [Folsomia candida]